MKYDTDYMIIVAHPDDIEFGCGGSIAHWRDEGRRIVYVVCTSGDKGSNDPAMLPEKLAGIREQEQISAAAHFGITDVEFLGYPDQELEDTASFRKELVRQMRKYRPEVVITMDPYRRYIWHRDHRITGQVCLDAVFPYVRDPLAYPDLLEENLAAHKVREIWFFGSEDINHRIDITATFQRKIDALFSHTSQMDSMGREKVESWVRKRCMEMAEGTEFQYVEGFHRVVIPS